VGLEVVGVAVAIGSDPLRIVAVIVMWWRRWQY